jgi:hypothetical protein
MTQEGPRKRKSAKRQTATPLNRSLEKKLLAYVAAAGAAGVAFLASSPIAEAQVVYTPSWIPIIPHSAAALDLNSDGMTDFLFSANNQCSTTSRGHCSTLRVIPQNASNAIWGTNSSASALASGVSIGSGGKLQAGHEFMGNARYSIVSDRYGSAGQWRQTTRAFLGLKFMIQGQIHFGWARLNVTATNGAMYAAITGYAYESQPNTPIRTGQMSGEVRKKNGKGGKRGSAPLPIIASMPGSLGMLALGASGLSAWREESMRPVVEAQRPGELQ